MTGTLDGAEGAPGTGVDRFLAALALRATAVATAVAVLAGGMVLFGTVMPSDKPPPPPPYAAMDPAAPVRLVVPSLRVTAPVVPIALSADRVLDPPADVLDVGWWDASAEPGAREGSTVIAGHTVHTGGGSLDRLGEIRRGATVDVVTRHGTMRYQVLRRKVYDKQELAVRATEVFGQTRGQGRLVLISCTDWDGEAYDSNVVVYAAPLGTPVGGA